MSRLQTAGGEVGGSAREWGGNSSGGGALIPARGPTCQILIIIQLRMFESSLKLLFPILFHASVFHASLR